MAMRRVGRLGVNYETQYSNEIFECYILKTKIMVTKNITIAGFILTQKTKKGIANLKVEAWDREMLVDDFVGSVVTNSEVF